MVWLNDLGDCFESSWRELLALTILLFDSYFVFLLRTYVICLHFIVYWNVRLDLVSVDWMPIDCRWQGKRNVNHTHTHTRISIKRNPIEIAVWSKISSERKKNRVHLHN